MTLISHIRSLAKSVLRLPAFFILEKWFLSTSDEIWSEMPYRVVFPFLATLIILLEQDELINLYMKLFGSFLLIIAAEYIQHKIPEPTSNGFITNDSDLRFAFLLCTITGLLAASLLRAKDWSAVAAVMANNLPIMAVSIGLPQYATHYVQNLTSAIIACFFISCVLSSSKGLINKWRTSANTYTFTKHKLDSIQQHLLVFWLVFFIRKAVFRVEKIFSWSELLTLLSICVEECCRTFVGLMAFSVVVARATLLFKVFLYDSRTSRHNNGGLVESVTFFLISTQIGALEKHNTVRLLNVERQVILLKSIILFVITTFLDAIYQTFNSKIMSFSASTKLSKLIGAFMMYIILLILSCYAVYAVCQLMGIATSLPVVIITGSTIIQILGSLLVYSLFLYDVKYSVENLDDTLFYIRSTMTVLVFMGYIVITTIGLWVIKTQGLSSIPTTCLIIHSYFNIFNSFKDSYDDSILRRNFRKKIRFHKNGN